MIYFALYLILQANILKAALMWGGVILLCWSAIASLFRFLESKQMWDKFMKRLTIGALACGTFSVVLPSTQNAALIVGGGQVYEVLTSSTAKELAGDVMDKVREAITGKAVTKAAPDAS